MNNPPAWVLYALATLARATEYGTPDLLATWQAWAGGSSTAYLPPEGVLFSGVAVVSDGTNAIVSYEGSRSTTQIFAQIVGSGQGSSPSYVGKCSTFDYWYAVQRNAEVFAELEHLPPGSGITLIGHSLGAAVAQVTNNVLQVSHAYAPLSLVTYGQPRTGNSEFAASTVTPFTRVVNAGDPVPAIPPTYSTVAALLSLFSTEYLNWNYEHTSPSWDLSFNSMQQNFTQTPTGAVEWQVAGAIATGNIFAGEFSRNHYLGAYTYNLQSVLALQTGFPNVTPLVQMNAELDQLDRITYGAPQPPLTVPSPGVFADPHVAILPTPAAPVIPSQDVGQSVELRGLTFTPPISSVLDPILSRSFMSAPYAKITLFFQCKNQGWSETWWDNAVTGGPDTMVADAQSLATKRICMCGPETSINFIRISVVTLPLVFPAPPRQSRIYPQNPPITTTFSTVGPGDVPENALLCQCTTASNAQKKLVYMRGLPDSAVINAGQINVSPGNYFGGNWTRWVNYIKSGRWGWTGKLTGVIPNAISALTQILPGGTISFVCGGNPFAGVPVGSIISVRFSKISTPGNLNGVHPVVVMGANSGQTRKPIAMLPWSNNGFVTWNAMQFNPVTQFNFQRIGERKVGRIFSPPRGRARVRPTA